MTPGGKIVIWLGEDPFDTEREDLSDFITEVNEVNRKYPEDGWPIGRFDLVCLAFELVFRLAEEDPADFAP